MSIASLLSPSGVATVPPSLCTKSAAPVQQRKSERCIQSYRGCTTIRLTKPYSALFGLLPCALTASYTYFMRHHGISQSVYKDCAGTHKETQVNMLYTSLQWLYQNAICISVVRIGWYNDVHIIGIVHLLYEAPRDRTICVQRCVLCV